VKALDHFLQKWRIRKALPFVRTGDRLLDIGCHDRTLINQVLGRVTSATGVDLHLKPQEDEKVRLLRGNFPEDFDFEQGIFDCVSLLAVLEHVKDPELLAYQCHHVLSPGGRVVLTVPHPFVDQILEILMFLHLIDGMAAEEHHGFDTRSTIPVFQKTGLTLLTHRRFQFGLNQLFVFEKPRAQS
jgi:2-polyprenyl-3-methyl-5-hydroxy-6-metoxy-1,4-benzoquinol methylase